jgi:hypothetical protein
MILAMKYESNNEGQSIINENQNEEEKCRSNVERKERQKRRSEKKR